MKSYIIPLLCGTLARVANPPSTEQIQIAAEKGVALLQGSQRTWDSKQFGGQGCISCHHQLLPAMVDRVARAHGLRVNEDLVQYNAVRTCTSRTDLDHAVQYTHVIGPSLADGFRLVAEDAAVCRANLVRAIYARLIAARQSPSGAWDRDSIHQRPPSSYSPFTSTALALHAVQLYCHPSLKSDTDARVVRARKWLLSQKPRDTEERTLQLFGVKGGVRPGHPGGPRA